MMALMNVRSFQPREIEQKIMIEGQMLLHCGPMPFLASTEALPTDVFANATFGLVDTGARKILVTCEHVWSEFLTERDKNPRAQLVVLLGTGRPIILPPDTFIDADKSLDLATFDMQRLLHEFSKRRFFPLNLRPPPVIRPKDVLTVAGYLGGARHTSAMGADFRYHFIGVSVADVSRFHVCADLANTKTVRDPDGEEIPSVDLGGLSGSPAYKLGANTRLSLVGFVTSTAMRVVRITHASCLNTDGSLLRPT